MWAQAFKTYYRLHDLATSWDQARQICEAEGSSLLIPDSLDEMENLKLLISNMKAHYSAIFVGLHNKFSHGVFVTLKGTKNYIYYVVFHIIQTLTFSVICRTYN